MPSQPHPSAVAPLTAATPSAEMKSSRADRSRGGRARSCSVERAASLGLQSCDLSPLWPCGVAEPKLTGCLSAGLIPCRRVQGQRGTPAAPHRDHTDWAVSAPSAAEGQAWMRRAARAMHWALLLLTIALPLTGLFDRWARGRSVMLVGQIRLAPPFVPLGGRIWDEVHETLADLLVVAVAVHVLAALWHAVVLRAGALLPLVSGTGRALGSQPPLTRERFGFKPGFPPRAEGPRPSPSGERGCGSEPLQPSPPAARPGPGVRSARRRRRRSPLALPAQ